MANFYGTAPKPRIEPPAYTEIYDCREPSMRALAKQFYDSTGKFLYYTKINDIVIDYINRNIHSETNKRRKLYKSRQLMLCLEETPKKYKNFYNWYALLNDISNVSQNDLNELVELCNQYNTNNADDYVNYSYVNYLSICYDFKINIPFGIIPTTVDTSTDDSRSVLPTAESWRDVQFKLPKRKI